MSPKAAPGRIAAVFAVFAFAYFFSALVRAVTATLAPVFSAELALDAANLGLLAGAYFLGFSVMQLPMGSALDRHGPRRVLLVLLAVAAVGCLAFALAQGLAQLLAARLLIGIGVSACLMAPLTWFRRQVSAEGQLRANSWMLMTGSLGMLSATLPTQWLLPLIGWRGLFVALAVLFVVAALGVRLVVPAADADAPAPAPVVPGPATPAAGPGAKGDGGYRAVFRHPVFRRNMPMAVLAYGGLLAMQTLWIGPWLTTVAGQTPWQASTGLFLVNLAMLVSFLAWGAVMPMLNRRGWAGERLIVRAWWPGIAVLAWIVWLGPEAGAAHWALWCVCTSVVTLSQPAVGQAFPAHLAGRALSAFNLLIFAGVFLLQWGIGLAIDALSGMGMDRATALRVACGGLAACAMLSYLWLWWGCRVATGVSTAPAAQNP